MDNLVLLVSSLIVLSSVLSVRGYISDGPQSYSDYSVLRFVPQTEDQLIFLYNLSTNDLLLMEKKIDFWVAPTSLNYSVDIMMSPKARSEMLPLFESQQLNSMVMIEDVQSRIDAENSLKGRQSFPFGLGSKRSNNDYFNSYQRYDQILKKLDSWANEYPNLAKTVTIGKTYEGRPMKIIKIDKENGSKKMKVWIDAGIHAREWIAPATAMFIVHELLTKAGKDNDIDAILDKYSFEILPSANPDGYEYSHTTNRMWRKTRSQSETRWGFLCRGVDPNRNWSYKWRTGGSSNNPCSDIYAGPSPFSEPETKAMSKYLKENGPWALYLSFHSYSQLLLMPWGWTSDLPQDYKEMYRVADKAAASLKSHFDTIYTIGSSTNLLYVASGGSDDWAYGELGIKYSYTMELRDEGTHGFTLPEDQITPTGVETFSAIKTMLSEIYKN